MMTTRSLATLLLVSLVSVGSGALSIAPRASAAGVCTAEAYHADERGYCCPLDPVGSTLTADLDVCNRGCVNDQSQPGAACVYVDGGTQESRAPLDWYVQQQEKDGSWVASWYTVHFATSAECINVLETVFTTTKGGITTTDLDVQKYRCVNDATGARQIATPDSAQPLPTTGTGKPSANSATGDNTSLTNYLGSGIGIFELLNSILAFAIRIGTVVIILTLVYIGYLYVSARGNPGKIEAAHKALGWTVVGALILLGSQVIAMGIAATVQALATGN